jgi:ADP-dependent phosphofructokinase/glucokinase
VWKAILSQRHLLSQVTSVSIDNAEIASCLEFSKKPSLSSKCSKLISEIGKNLAILAINLKKKKKQRL